MLGQFILTCSAVVLGICGATTLFAPEELARLFDPAASPAISDVIQLSGSGLLGFALLNWLSRRNRIGGIYALPLALGNLLLFTTAALSLGKAVAAGRVPMSSLLLCALLSALAVSFAWLVFAHDPTSGDASRRP
jgi:hypothetical protein